MAGRDPYRLALCKIRPGRSLSKAEKKAQIEERRELIRQAQARNKGISNRLIERQILDAVEKVRSRPKLTFGESFFKDS
jgi:hypothetical protein